MEEKEVFYIYRHLRKDSGEPFYIGLGKVYNPKAKTHEKYYSRAFQKTKRNRFWNFVVEKTDYEVEIVFEANDRQTIIEKEIEFIALYGRRDLGKGTLVNMSDGGDGLNNNIQSEETIEKRRKMYAEGRTGLKGLSGKDSPVAKKVIEESTGKIFNTVTEAAEHLDITSGNLSDMLRNTDRKNTSGLRYLDEELNFEYIDKRRNVKVYDYGAGNIIESLSEASRLYKISVRFLSAVLNGRYKNKTPLVYYEDYLDGVRPDDLYVDKRRNKKVINTITKEIYDSMLEASIAAGMTKSCFANKMKGIRPNNTPYMLLSEYNEKLTTNIYYL